MSTNLLESRGFLQIDTLDNAMKVSEIISKSEFCPTQLRNKPGDILVCLQLGAELGLKPMQALQNIAVINGRPSVWGDAMLAVCRQHPDFEFIKEEYNEKEKRAYCTVKRKFEPEYIRTFSIDDAEKAQLLDKKGPWQQYTKRMLQMRARGFALRDSFPDTLRGIMSREEAEDIESPKKGRQRIDYSNTQGTIIEGQIVDEPKIQEHQLLELQSAIDESGSNAVQICKLLGIESLPEMKESDFQEIMRKIQIKLNRKRKAVEIPIDDVVETPDTAPE